MRFAAAVVRAVSRFRTSRIGLRVLAFNILVLFLPVAGILYLDVYEARLLETQERGMIEQARLVAAALGGRDGVAPADAEALLARLGSEGESRIRVFGRDGGVLADSRRVFRQPATTGGEYSGAAPARAGGRTRVLYRVGAWLAGVKDKAGELAASLVRSGRDPDEPTPLLDPPPEVRAALGGRYGAATRPTPGQRSLTLTSAVPIHSGGTVTGAVVVSQSTFRMLQALYGLRLRIFEVVLASMALAALLSLLMSATIVKPLVRLRRAAALLAERRAPLSGTFNVVTRQDEIGDLARALDQLASRLEAHIRLLESFAADVSHEFRNPLASIRTAAEMLVTAENGADRDRFFSLLTKDVDRLERLVAGVRELARIDAQLAHEPAMPIDVGGILADLIDGRQLRYGRSDESLRASGRSMVRASPDRLIQVFDNILENARSFAPGGPIDISVRSEAAHCTIAFEDRGPGIPPGHLDRVFERFFSYRQPDSGGRGGHAGLGLAIARTIVEGYGGSMSARNREGGGACFEVRLPLVQDEARLTRRPATVERIRG
jgi:two-component system sensor histidine kinase ChvG